MTDFTSMDEAYAFSHIRGVPDKMTPLVPMDQYEHRVYLVDDGVDPADYGEMMYRFQKTFCPDTEAPGGADVVYEI